MRAQVSRPGRSSGIAWQAVGWGTVGSSAGDHAVAVNLSSLLNRVLNGDLGVAKDVGVLSDLPGQWPTPGGSERARAKRLAEHRPDGDLSLLVVYEVEQQALLGVAGEVDETHAAALLGQRVDKVLRLHRGA